MSRPVTPDPNTGSDPDDRAGALGTPLDRYADDAPTRTDGLIDTPSRDAATAPPTPAMGIPARPVDGTYDTGADTGSDTIADRGRGSRTAERFEYVNSAPVVDRDESPDLLTQEKAEFGGIKFGSAFLGWLTTVGSIVVLAAILAAVASGMNLDSNTSSSDLQGVGLGAAIALLVVLFLGYLAGGYVAGRMARFHGVRQGIAVWLWGLVIAIALSITAAIVGSQSTILVQANLPQIPFTSSGFTWQAILALVAVLLATLLGAILGGLMGMRFHRRIDRFAADNTPNSSRN